MLAWFPLAAPTAACQSSMSEEEKTEDICLTRNSFTSVSTAGGYQSSLECVLHVYSPPLSSTTSLTTPNVSWYLNLTSRSSPLPQVVQTDQVQSSTWTGTRPGQARSPHTALCLPSSAAGSVQACQSVGQYNVRREEIKTLSKQIPCNLVFKNNFSSIEMSFLLHNLYSPLSYCPSPASQPHWKYQVPHSFDLLASPHSDWSR